MSINPLDNAHLKTLLVSEAGRPKLPFTRAPIHHLTYSFTDVDVGDGFSAWELERSAEQTNVEVHSACAPLTGGYRQQALNRFFAKALLVHRPDVVVVCGLAGCTLDLPRVAALFSIPCILHVENKPTGGIPADAITEFWIEDALQKCAGVFISSTIVHEESRSHHGLLDKVSSAVEDFSPLLTSLAPKPFRMANFDYAVYELCSRDHPLLMKMQEPDARHFAGMGDVLDVGCGAGLFLDILRGQGVEAVGVEQNASIADYGRAMGLNIETADALSFLAQGDSQFEGIYCSHFVEHLPIDAVHELIRLFATRLMENGVLVLVFPDPESIRSQLLGFWRDPEHVRFYHPDLIISIAVLMGFEVEWTSHEEQPHSVGYFPETPAPLQKPEIDGSDIPFNPEQPEGFFKRLLGVLGLVSSQRVENLEAQLAHVNEKLNAQAAGSAKLFEQLADRTERLWEVNQTWAWSDNVTIKLRKRHSAV